MNRWRLFVVLVFLVHVLWGQQGNPFDIKNRKDTVLSESNIKNIEAVKPNVNDTLLTPSKQILGDSSDAAPRPNPAQVQPQIQNADSNSDSYSDSDSDSDSFLEKRQQQLINENPFNVSHIPVKKKLKKSPIQETIKQETPNINTSSGVAQSSETLNTKVEETKSTNDDVTTQIIDEETVEHILPDNIKEISTNKFIFWILFLQLLLITSLIGINREFIPKISRSISNDNFAKLIARDYSNGYNALFVILYIIFFLSLSMFIYLGLRYFTGFNGFAKYLIILLAVVGVYFVRHIFQNMTASIFPFGKESTYYDFMIILFNVFLGLVLIPFNVIISYAPAGITQIAVFGGIGIILIFYSLRILRGMLNAYTFARNYLFHFFLYLCTCEIAPVFILVKLFSKSFIN